MALELLKFRTLALLATMAGGVSPALRRKLHSAVCTHSRRQHESIRPGDPRRFGALLEEAGYGSDLDYFPCNLL